MESEKFIVIDTETANTIEEPFCYDVGFAVVGMKNVDEVYT